MLNLRLSISCWHDIATLKVLRLTLIECVRRAADSSDDMDNLALRLEVLRLEVASDVLPSSSVRDRLNGRRQEASRVLWSEP